MTTIPITLKPGWLASFHEGFAVLTSIGHPPYRIDLGSVEEGEQLPRDTDRPIEGWNA